MRFHRSLGDVQVVSDFRVVTSLQQKIDNLPLPWSHLAEMFFHKKLRLTDTPRLPQVALKPAPSARLDLGLCVSFCIHAAKMMFCC